MQTAELNSLDATFLNLDRRDNTWSVHYEIRVEKHLNREKLEQAVRKAIQRHPIARARLAEFGETDSRYFWEIPDEIDHLPISRWRAETNAEIRSIRNRLISLQIPLSLSPSFLLYWIEHKDGDWLMLNVPHTLADGLSCHRLMQSIIRAYAFEEDPLSEPNPLDVRNLAELAGSKTLSQRLDRAKILLDHLGKAGRPPVRFASDGGTDDAHGYGFFPLELDAEQTARFMTHRQKPATVNDMILAAMALTIQGWNEARHKPAGRIALMMPVNLRPQEWWHEVIGNYSSYVSVSIEANCPDKMGELAREVCEQTTAFKEAGAAGTLIDLLQIPKFLPAALKEKLKDLFPVFGKVLMETSWVSNLGRLPDNQSMGDAGRITSISFSPPAPMPCSLSVGTLCLGDRLIFGFRYKRSEFSHESVSWFASRFMDHLLHG